MFIFFRPGQPGIAQFFNRPTAQAVPSGLPPLVAAAMNGTAAAPAVAPQPPQPAQAAPPAAVNGSSPAAPVTKAPAEAPLPVSKDSKANVVDKPVDEESKKGRFGWFDIEKVRGRNLSETTNLAGVCCQVEYEGVQHSIP